MHASWNFWCSTVRIILCGKLLNFTLFSRPALYVGIWYNSYPQVQIQMPYDSLSQSHMHINYQKFALLLNFFFFFLLIIKLILIFLYLLVTNFCFCTKSTKMNCSWKFNIKTQEIKSPILSSKKPILLDHHSYQYFKYAIVSNFWIN